jgi:hypothetical protein
MSSAEADGQYSPEEAAGRRDTVIKRMLPDTRPAPVFPFFTVQMIRLFLCTTA